MEGAAARGREVEIPVDSFDWGIEVPWEGQKDDLRPGSLLAVARERSTDQTWLRVYALDQCHDMLKAHEIPLVSSNRRSDGVSVEH